MLPLRPGRRVLAHGQLPSRGPPTGAGTVPPVTSRTAEGAAPQASAEALWSGLDQAWQAAFRQAWEAFCSGNIAVGACATDAAGTVVHASRNRVADRDGPRGEIFGSALAHAEVNVLARLRFGQARELVLTTTLEPCLQCSAAIRLGPVSAVRFAGADPLWAGCHDFGRLSPREAARPPVERDGPRPDELGVFGTLIARFWPHGARTEAFLRSHGESGILVLIERLRAGGITSKLVEMEVDQALAFLWPELRAMARAPEASPPPVAGIQPVDG